MHLGISIDKVQLKATVLDDQFNTVYSSQQSLKQTTQEVKQQVFQLVDNFQWAYGTFCSIGLAITEEVLAWFDCHHLALHVLIEQHYRVRCSKSNFVEAGLQSSPDTLSQIKLGKVLCVVLDNECELYSCNKTRRGISQRTIRSIPWAHVALPDYDFAFDGLVTTCSCASEACTEQFVSVSGLERQYEQILLKCSNVKEILCALESGDSIAARTYRRYIDQLARALKPHIRNNEPRTLLILGSVSRYAHISSDLKFALSRYWDASPLPVMLALPYEDFSISRGATQTKAQRLVR
ncbi:ROK family protein [Vibrio gallicus]|uniref:ROK family protein n=1 Tax=Vibrio gallicus TaxID=190897 RepID=UPI0021C259EF|nr:ROK family protein [Vibrio gallicus]